MLVKVKTGSEEIYQEGQFSCSIKDRCGVGTVSYFPRSLLFGYGCVRATALESPSGLAFESEAPLPGGAFLDLHSTGRYPSLTKA